MARALRTGGLILRTGGWRPGGLALVAALLAAGALVLGLAGAEIAEVLAWPGALEALARSLWTGILATWLARLFTALLLCRIEVAGWTRRVAPALAPLLAVPHAAFAVALAFLLAPSGWLVRLFLAPFLGRDHPPDWPLPGDPWGAALILGLVLKEVPFLLFLGLAARARLRLAPAVACARTLGCDAHAAFFRTVWPQLQRRLRLPILAVLAYGLGNADMATILGPDLPPTFAVLIVRWFLDPDPAGLERARAGALVLALVATAVLAAWHALELRSARGTRPTPPALPVRLASALVLAAFAALAALALCGLALWAFAGPWPYPEPLPRRLDPGVLAVVGADLGKPLVTTLQLGLATALLGLLLARPVLGLVGRPRRESPPLWLFVPLLVPDVVVALWLQSWSLYAGLGPTTAVVVGHLAYVLPYQLLVLWGPWRRLPANLFDAARTLGAPAPVRFWHIERPLLGPVYAAALAVGFAVSASQYATTLLLGAGRVRTLATETVAYAATGDRRLAACAGLLAALLPALAFLAAARVAPGEVTRAGERTVPRSPLR